MDSPATQELVGGSAVVYIRLKGQGRLEHQTTLVAHLLGTAIWKISCVESGYLDGKLSPYLIRRHTKRDRLPNIGVIAYSLPGFCQHLKRWVGNDEDIPDQALQNHHQVIDIQNVEDGDVGPNQSIRPLPLDSCFLPK